MQLTLFSDSSNFIIKSYFYYFYRHSAHTSAVGGMLDFATTLFIVYPASDMKYAEYIG